MYVGVLREVLDNNVKNSKFYRSIEFPKCMILIECEFYDEE